MDENTNSAELVKAWTEEINPIIIWTIAIFCLVCGTLPLVFITEYYFFRDWYKVYPDQEDDDWTSEDIEPDEASTIQSRTEFILYVTKSGRFVDSPPDEDQLAASSASSVQITANAVIQTDQAAPRKKCGGGVKLEAKVQTEGGPCGPRKLKREGECDDGTKGSRNEAVTQTERKVRKSGCSCPCGGDETKSHLCTCAKKQEIDTQTCCEDRDKDGGCIDLSRRCRDPFPANKVNKFLQWDWDNPCTCPEEYVARRVKGLSWFQVMQYAQADGGEWEVNDTEEDCKEIIEETTANEAPKKDKT